MVATLLVMCLASPVNSTHSCILASFELSMFLECSYSEHTRGEALKRQGRKHGRKLAMFGTF